MGKKTGQNGDRPGPGRPRLAPALMRRHRVVTFVTDAELKQLRQMAREEDRSMASFVHRILKGHIAV